MMMTLESICNKETLNIFTDTSTLPNINDSCYGAIALCCNTIIDKDFRCCNKTTVSLGELRGLRLGIEIGAKQRTKYKTINIFSDSSTTVKTFNEWLYNWKVKGEVLYSKQKSPVINQSMIIEIMKTINFYNFNNLHIYHTKGHVVLSDINSLKHSAKLFKTQNGIDIDLDCARYLAKYNDKVDKNCKYRVKSTIMTNGYNYPLQYYPHNYDVEMRQLYFNLFNTKL
jgi:ribonuclease HI